MYISLTPAVKPDRLEVVSTITYKGKKKMAAVAIFSVVFLRMLM